MNKISIPYEVAPPRSYGLAPFGASETSYGIHPVNRLYLFFYVPLVDYKVHLQEYREKRRSGRHYRIWPLLLCHPQGYLKILNRLSPESYLSIPETNS